MFQIQTAVHSDADSASAARACIATLGAKGIATPSYVMVQADMRLDLAAVARELRLAWPRVAVHAATSCLGGMTDEGIRIGPQPALTILAIQDPDGDYATASAALGDDPRGAAAAATREALAGAERQGERPTLVWLSSSPGQEERVIAGIQDVLGDEVPIVGGSAADNSIAGDWAVLADGAALQDGVVVSALFPSVAVGASFHSGYTPSDLGGCVTRGSGRTIEEIDGMPAAQCYADWTAGAVGVPEQGRVNVLMASALWPLGRETGNLVGSKMHMLSHPETLGEDGTITLFTDIQQGDRITLMTGTEDTLLARPADVALSACRLGEMEPEAVTGMILVFCAGCMLTVRERLDEAALRLAQAMPEVPYITAFTFGEQGPVLSGVSRHGNLMISAVVFGR